MDHQWFRKRFTLCNLYRCNIFYYSANKWIINDLRICLEQCKCFPLFIHFSRLGFGKSLHLPVKKKSLHLYLFILILIILQINGSSMIQEYAWSNVNASHCLYIFRDLGLVSLFKYQTKKKSLHLYLFILEHGLCLYLILLSQFSAAFVILYIWCHLLRGEKQLVCAIVGLSRFVQ